MNGLAQAESPRILVVDDDPTTRTLMRLIFESAGYQVHEAANGLNALVVIDERAPDLLITDIMMPVMDGIALIQRLKSRTETARLPILAVSGNPNAQYAAANADAVLGKPFDRAHLLSVVSTLLARGNPEAA